jgi:hypothetical protein
MGAEALAGDLDENGWISNDATSQHRLARE